MEASLKVVAFTDEYVNEAKEVWNEVVREGCAFPQENELTVEEAIEFFKAQSFTGLAINTDGLVVGLYILHPNNIGRCGHICNASYAVRSALRGQHIGENLVRHSMVKGLELGFRVLQFNAVVAENTRALKLYASLGFVRLGVIPGGFLGKDGRYIDIIPHYIELTKVEATK